jgi:hypothetical protein
MLQRGLGMHAGAQRPRWPMDLPAFMQEVMRTLRTLGKPTTG